jgi:secreted trypsin-like serine protease
MIIQIKVQSVFLLFAFPENKLKMIYCLVRNHVRRTRMTNGQFVEPGHFPWIVALLIKQDYINSDPLYVCSASLVSSWNIITAAHCLDEQYFRK